MTGFGVSLPENPKVEHQKLDFVETKSELKNKTQKRQHHTMQKVTRSLLLKHPNTHCILTQNAVYIEEERRRRSCVK